MEPENWGHHDHIEEAHNHGPGNALIVWELFKIYGGQIHAVEAFMEIMPAKAGSGWN